MKEKIRTQKGFIQIPLLIIIIASIIAATGIGYRVSEDHKTSDKELFSIVTTTTTITTPEHSTPITTIASPIPSTITVTTKPPITTNRPATVITTTTTTVLSTTTTTITTITPPTTIMTTTTEGETYDYHDYFPIIISLSDNKGNIVKYSGTNGYKGPYHYFQPNKTLKIGDKIELEIKAYDPKNRKILYNYHSNNSKSHFDEQVNSYKNGKYNWTTNNKIIYTITSETLKDSGEYLRIVVLIRTEKEYFRITSSGRGKYDDAIFIDYNLF